MDFLKQIDKLIQQLVLDGDFETEFRPPITGCASADDQFFQATKISYPPRSYATGGPAPGCPLSDCILFTLWN